MQNKRVVALQTDPIEGLKTASDTSLYIAAELAKREYKTFFYTPEDLMLIGSELYASGVFAEVNYADYKSSFSILETARLKLNEVHAVMIRQDPPFNMDYVTNTYLLEGIMDKVLVLNNPAAIRSNSEKMMCFKFPSLIPATIVIRKVTEEVIDFIKNHHDVVVKPLYWFGGKYSQKISSSKLDEAIASLNESIKNFGHVIIQKFLNEIYEGDKRIIVVDGKPEGVLKRVPQDGNFVANLAAGGLGATTDITGKEHKILEQVCPYLKKEGIILAGVDVIADHLIEINVTSPTGLVAINKLYGINIAAKIVDYVDKSNFC